MWQTSSHMTREKSFIKRVKKPDQKKTYLGADWHLKEENRREETKCLCLFTEFLPSRKQESRTSSRPTTKLRKPARPTSELRRPARPVTKLRRPKIAQEKFHSPYAASSLITIAQLELVHQSVGASTQT